MYYLYIALLILSPLPVCYFLYRYFEKTKATLSGTLANKMHFNLSGVLVVYLLIVLFNCLALTPDVLGINCHFTSSKWKYEYVLYPTEIILVDRLQEKNRKSLNFSGKTYRNSGETLMWHRKNNIVKFKTTHQVEKNIEHFGIVQNQKIYIPFTTFTHKNVIGFGDFDNKSMLLRTHTLFKSSADIDEPLRGFIELTRIWPMAELLLLTYIPILIVFLLNQISPLTVRIRVSRLLSPPKDEAQQNKLSLTIADSIACYFLIYALIVVLISVSGQSISTNNKINMGNFCASITGTWYYALYAGDYIDPNPHPPMNGKINVRCEKEQLLISGYHNYKLTDDCDLLLGEHSVNWKVTHYAVERDQLIAIYESSEFDKTVGITTGIVDFNDKTHAFYIYDYQSDNKKFYDPIYGKSIISRDPKIICNLSNTL